MTDNVEKLAHEIAKRFWSGASIEVSLPAALTAAGLELNKAGTREALKPWADEAALWPADQYADDHRIAIYDIEDDSSVSPVNRTVADLRTAAALTKEG